MRGGLGGHTQERRVKNEEDGFPFFMEHTRLGVVEKISFSVKKGDDLAKTVPQDELSKTSN